MNSEALIISSKYLGRDVTAEIVLPPHFSAENSYPLLVLNDGQDMAKIDIDHIMSYVYKKDICRHIVIVAPHALHRMDEYGVSGHPDFKQRGAKAGDYTQFITEELIPAVSAAFPGTHFYEMAIGGFSLGALSAFDIAWNHSEMFSKVGAFSPSFWWRKKDLKAGYTDADRIMHQVVRETEGKPSVKVWFQCGTLDEANDRNKNGIIDSIDDTLDLMEELKQKGYHQNHDFWYTETISGRHTLETYSIMLPFFLAWAFGK